MKRYLSLAVALALLLWLLSSIAFTVDETQYAIVTTLGNPSRILLEPGLKWKLPTPIQTILLFDKRLQVFDPRPNESFTQDRKNLVVDSFTCWRISDPKLFLQKVGSIPGAEKSLEMLIASELGTELGKHELSDLVSVEPEEVKLTQIMEAVTQRCHDTALKSYGIDIADVRIKRINLPDENKESVYERMRAEREQKAKEYRAQGEEQAMGIRSKTETEKRDILSKAYEEAQRIKGKGDAEAIRIYHEAYSKDPDFYKFMRTLNSYKKILGEDTTVVLSSETDFLKLLTQFDPSALAGGEDNPVGAVTAVPPIGSGAPLPPASQDAPPAGHRPPSTTAEHPSEERPAPQHDAGAVLRIPPVPATGDTKDTSSE